MKNTLTHPPIIPADWKPKPSKEHHTFLDWLVAFQNWQIYVGIIKIN